MSGFTGKVVGDYLACGARVSYLCRARVLAAFFAAADRSAGPFVRDARFAAAERSTAVRLLALDRAWRAKDVGDADGRFAVLWLPLSESSSALWRAAADVVPFFGGLTFTPARAQHVPLGIVLPRYPSRDG